MPTAARLVAALSLAVLAVVLSRLIMPLMPEGTDFGYFTWVNAALGVIVGWRLVGPRAAQGQFWGIANGLTGAAALVLLGLLLQGAATMFRLAHRNLYDDPFEAFAAVFTIALEYFFIMAVPQVLVAVLIGGAVVGILAKRASSLWK